MKWLLPFVLLLAFITSPAQAATWFVATTGSDSNNGTAVGTPFRSIQKGASVAQLGDTVTVADGTYTDNDNPAIQSAGLIVWVKSSYTNGSAQAPITVKATNPLGAVLNISSTRTTTASNIAFYVNRDYWTFTGFDITGGAAVTAPASNGAFTVLANTGVVIRYNRMRSIARTLCYNAPYGNVGVLLVGAISPTIEYNDIHGIGRLRNGESGCSTTIFQHDHGIYIDGATGPLLRRNIIYDSNRGYPIQIYGGTVTNGKIYNNTLDGHSPTGSPAGQIIFGSTITTLDLKDNIFSNPGVGPFHGFTTAATGVTYDYNLTDDPTSTMFNASDNGKTAGFTDGGHNLVNTSPGFVAGTNNFNLNTGSAAIDAGVDIGAAYNGTKPDIGANETIPTNPACVVENATPSKLSITFTNNLNPPLLPTSPAFGTNKFTSRKATVDNPVTAATRVGTNQVDLTLTNAIVGGNAVDFSYSTAAGDLTDSANIGGNLNQRLNAITNLACTNNVGAPATYQMTQVDFAWHGLRGTEAAPVNTPYAAAPQNTNIFAVPGAQARLRVSLKASVADVPAKGYIPYYSTTGAAGAYTLLSDTFTADGIAFCGTSPDPDIPTSGTATTNQLTTTGTFVSGALIRTSNAIPTIAIPNGQKSEMEYCIAFASTVSATSTFDIRVRFQDGTVLNTYTTTPKATIIGAQHGSGF